MKVSWEWLSDFVDLSGTSPDEVAERLTLAGLEVDSVHRLGDGLSGLVTAQVTAVDRHPNADKLSLVTVATDEQPVTVVCGAPNVAVGQTVVLARVGARLPGGKLKPAKIRGVRSEGMIVSEAELDLPESVYGIWVPEEGVPVGVDAVEALGLTDTVITLDLTPNRPDCLSVHGVAREVAAALGRPLTPLQDPDLSDLEGGAAAEELAAVDLEDPAGCPRYTARVLEGVEVRPAPWWMRRRLHAVGVRPISNVVDVTNYVLMEWGQPLHAFDLDRLAGARIVVRRARPGERMTTLDDVERVFDAEDLLIADAERAVAVAGVMGGEDSEVRPETSRLLLESAYFDPACVRRTSHRHALQSESSHRFERGIDPNMPADASARAARLFVETAGGELRRGVIDCYPRPVEPLRLSVSVRRINRLLGTRLRGDAVSGLLGSIDLPVQACGDDALVVTAPTRRPDLEREVDVAEEVARLYGYDRIEAVLPTSTLGQPHVARTLPMPEGWPAAEGASLPSPADRARPGAIRRALCAAGCHEHVAVPLVGRAALETLFPDGDDPRRHPVELKNPLGEEHAVLRTTLLPGLLAALEENVRHGRPDVRLFEIGRVFLRRPAGLPEEPDLLGLALLGHTPRSWADPGRELDYYDVRGALEGVLRALGVEEGLARFLPAREGRAPYLHPGAAAELWLDDDAIGVLGELHPDLRGRWDLRERVFVAEVVLGGIVARDGLDKAFRGLSRFPAVVRDGALVVDESVLAVQVLDAVRSHAATRKGRLVDDVQVFDVWRGPAIGEGRKSLAIKVRYAASDRTLTDEEVNAAHEALTDALEHTLGAELRST